MSSGHTTPATRAAHIPEGFSLPEDPEKALEEAIKSIEILQAIYERETENLQSANTQGFLNLQDEKLRAAQIYHATVRHIMKRKDEMKAASPMLKNKLVEMQQKFSSTSRQNLEEIQRMQRTVTRLGDTIRRAAKDAARRMRGYSYGETGQIEGEDKRSISMGVSETA